MRMVVSMTTKTTTASIAPPSLSGDLWGGFAAMLVALPSAIAFGVLIFSVMGPQYAGMGALAGILGSIALGLVTPWIGRTGGLIAAPCAPSAAVLSAMVASLLAGATGRAFQPDEILPLIAVTAILASVLQVVYGAIGGGRLIKFVPFQVVSGYLSGVGVLIALSQIPKLLGLEEGVPLLHGLIRPSDWVWQSLLVGLVTMGVTVLAPRVIRKVPATIVGLAGGMGAYGILAMGDPALRNLRDNPLIIGPIETSGSFLGAVAHHAASLFSVDPHLVSHVMIPALTLSVLLSIDTLKTCVVLDALTRGRHHSDRELLGQGMGNFIAGLIGGMPGAGTMGPTLVNVTSGGRTFRSGLVQGVLVVAVFFALGSLVAWVPIGALAGVLLIVAWRMIDWRQVKLLKSRNGRLDFAVIISVVLVAVAVDLIVATGVGIALAVLLFLRDQIRGSVIRRKHYLNQFSSKTRRLAHQRAILKAKGDQGVFCELQGNLFFGTTDQLLTQLDEDLKKRDYILLDMRRVQSMDFTAAHLLEQLQERLFERGGQLLLSGMPSGLLDERDFERYLAGLGVVRKGGGVMVSDTLDGALEWIENRILEQEGAAPEDDETLLTLGEIDLFRSLSPDVLNTLSACVREEHVPEGGRIFSCGDSGDEIYFVRKGSIRILLPLEGGRRHHLATIGRGDYFGELSFLDRMTRSADAEAKVASDFFILSRTAFENLQENAPALGHVLFNRLAVQMAERLRHTDMELRMIEER